MVQGLTIVLIILGLTLHPAVAADRPLPLDHALPDGSGDVLQRWQQARVLLSSGESGGAVRELAGVANELPENHNAWSDYALALTDSGQYRRAAAAIARCLEIAPNAIVANKVAVIIYERLGQHRDAYEVNQRLSTLGDRIAMYDIAEALLEGRGIPEDPSGAVRWMERAASAGHYGAMARLAQIYRVGLYGQSMDPIRSATWAMLADAD